MKGRTLTGITAATITTVGLGLGIVGGLAASEYDYNNEMERVEKDRAEQADIIEAQLELDATRDETAGGLGEACTRLLVQYSPLDGILEGTSENDILSDLLQVPGQPCGEVSTDVRAVVRGYIGSEVIIDEKQDEIDAIETAINERLENPEGDGENKVQALLGFGGVGLVAGGFAGLLTSMGMFSYYDGRSYSYSKRRWEDGPNK